VDVVPAGPVLEVAVHVEQLAQLPPETAGLELAVGGAHVARIAARGHEQHGAGGGDGRDGRPVQDVGLGVGGELRGPQRVERVDRGEDP
jgi:hypothetical protein